MLVDGKLVDELLDDALRPEDTVLQQIRRSSQEQGLPAIEVSAQQGKLLTLLVQLSAAQSVLELGTLGGYSTVCLARGVGKTGYVATVENNPEYAAAARIHLKQAEVYNRVDLFEGEALNVLYNLGTQGRNFDFVFIDADKEHNWTYVQTVLAQHLVKPGSVIMVDNVIREGRVLSQWEKAHFIRMLGAHPQLDATVIQTVGSKTWDGFALARVKETE
jgi:predicted O-methyltransferase YrrM